MRPAVTASRKRSRQRLLNASDFQAALPAKCRENPLPVLSPTVLSASRVNLASVGDPINTLILDEQVNLSIVETAFGIRAFFVAVPNHGALPGTLYIYYHEGGKFYTPMATVHTGVPRPYEAETIFRDRRSSWYRTLVVSTRPRNIPANKRIRVACCEGDVSKPCELVNATFKLSKIHLNKSTLTLDHKVVDRSLQVVLHDDSELNLRCALESLVADLDNSRLFGGGTTTCEKATIFSYGGLVGQVLMSQLAYFPVGGSGHELRFSHHTPPIQYYVFNETMRHWHSTEAISSVAVAIPLSDRAELMPSPPKSHSPSAGVDYSNIAPKPAKEEDVPKAATPSTACIFCLTYERSHMIIPCGHTVACVLCAHTAKHQLQKEECPVCRTHCTALQRVIP
jgi:hypothetical protein